MDAYTRASIFGFLTILIEIVLARALHFSLNSFVAWMCISAAMFGIGLGGLLFERWPKAERGVWILLGAFLLGLPYSHNHLSLNVDGPLAILNYGVLLFLLSAPFALIGWGLLQIFALPDTRTSYLYLFDLAGGAFGAGTAYLLLGYLSPAQILMSCGFLSLAFAPSHRVKRAGALVLAIVSAGFMIKMNPAWIEFQSKSEKRLSSYLASSSPERTFWTSMAKIDVVQTAQGWKNIIYDGGEMLSTIFPFDGDFPKLKSQLRERIFTDFWNPGVIASHALKEGRGSRVLAVGAAGGQEIKAAVLFGAQSVEVAELMGELLELGKNEYAEFNGGIFLRPEVTTFARDGRAHLRAVGDRSYDIIQLNSVHGSSSWGSSMGALQITPLVTVEAFGEYFSHLAPDGILHLNYPYSPRIVTTMSEAWRRFGRGEFRRHVIVVQSGGERDFLTTTLVKMSPWNLEEITQVEKLFRSVSSSSVSYIMTENPLGAGRLGEEFFDGRWKAIEGDLPYQVSPVTDDRPYFKFLRKGILRTERVHHAAISPDLDNYLYRWTTAGLPGDVFPLIALGGGGLIIFFVVFLVAIFRFRSSSREWSVALYFFFTGVSFIILETFFIYRTTLWLGSPHQALALALGTILIAAGLGGVFSRWNPWRTCLLSALVVALAARFSNGEATLFSMAIAGLALGMPFISGVQFMNLSDRSRSNAFLISGLGAGFGGYGAVVISLIWGFPMVLAVGVCGYLAAAVTARLSRA